MNRIDRQFERLKRSRERALVGFVTAGDPDKERSLAVIAAMCRGGADILELGIPFSDPTADGPVIQRSSSRALRSGMRTSTVLEMARAVRDLFDIPIILFSYYNPILAYGPNRFYREALQAGADGVLVVDLPPEESHEMTAEWELERFSLIRLIAPTTPPARMKTIADNATGFLYMVSKTGVTGSDGLDTSAVAAHIEALRKVTRLPICVGFGVSTPRDVSDLSRHADGVVIGSAFEKIIESHLDDPGVVSVIESRTREYKAATRISGDTRGEP